MEFLVMLLARYSITLVAGFHWKIHAMDGHGISGNATGWISLPMSGHGISHNATVWISLRYKSYCWTWNLL
jgi:hypothetical protein